MGDFNLLKPYILFEQLFEQKIRIEDRNCLDFADIDVTANVLSCCHGSAVVKLGKTHVIAGLKVKVVPESGNSGSITCNVEYAGLCNRGSRLNASQPKYAQCLSSSVQRLVGDVALPSVKKQLNIFPIGSDENNSVPSASYALKLDILILHDDGCLLDACVPAALVTLLTAKWTKLYAVTDKRATGSYLDCYKPGPLKEEKSLEVKQWPVSLSFCFIPHPVVENKHGGVPIIAQPTRRELDIWDTDAGSICLTLSRRGNIIDLSMVHAFLAGLWDTMAIPNSNGNDTVSIWNILFDSAVSQAQKIREIIEKAVM
ncbi:unnamed protein product [Trichobilharzia szidati]|nr:unnamed protein product [Trichobilharzia szidati]